MTFRRLPPIEWLEEHLNYNPISGVLTWKRQRDGDPRGRLRIIGGEASRLDSGNGYLRIFFPEFGYFGAHRVAFAMYHRRDPEMEIDHKDQNPLNNSSDNLRESTRLLNALNRNMSGVSWHPKRKKNPFQMRFKVGDKSISKVFPTEELAKQAYEAAKGAALTELAALVESAKRLRGMGGAGD